MSRHGEQLAALKLLAWLLNVDRREADRRVHGMAAVCYQVEDIITRPIGTPGQGDSPAATAFNEAAAEVPIFLRMPTDPAALEAPRAEAWPMFPAFAAPAGLHPAASADVKHTFAVCLWILTMAYFRGQGWRYLKRCPQCSKWFVDRTKPANQERCSSECTWRWWNRDRRRERSGASRPRRGPARGK